MSVSILSTYTVTTFYINTEEYAAAAAAAYNFCEFRFVKRYEVGIRMIKGINLGNSRSCKLPPMLNTFRTITRIIAREKNRSTEHLRTSRKARTRLFARAL